MMLPLHEEAIHHERLMRIICIGAGASGLCFAYKLQRSFRNFSLTVYEKNAELAGTWYESKYPGCTCDVPAHNYTYTFEPKLDWSSSYAKASEIKKYFNDFSLKYGLHKYIKTQQIVTRAQWVEDTSEWSIETKDVLAGTVTKQTCDILINACGYLNQWRWPDIPGLQKFEGKLLHTANWDESICLKDRIVGLIGNGASGIQVLPAVQPIAGKIFSFIRTPNWVLPPIGKGQQIYTQEELESFARNPKAVMAIRKGNETMLNSLFMIYLQDSPLQNFSLELLRNEMKKELHSHDLAEKLIPTTFGVGCRRLSPGPGYLESLQKENVTIVYGQVVEITKEGCQCDNGSAYPVDIIICATGYETSYRPRFPIVAGDLNLQDVWRERPKAYLGIAAAGFPNMFLLLGPNSPVGNGPVLSAIEAQTDHILSLLDRWQTENILTFCPKLAAVHDFIEHTDTFMKGTVWAQPCRSGYKNHTVNGSVNSLWPGSTLHHIEALKELRADDWDIIYRGNRFAWLGNGISQTEFDGTCDLGYYIRDHDDSPYLSRCKRREMLTKSGTQPMRTFGKLQREEGWN